MPKVDSDAELLRAAQRLAERHEGNRASAAREIGVSRLLFGRFLESGRVIERNRERLRQGLLNAGYLRSTNSSDTEERITLEPETIQISDLAKEVLTYLVEAVEARQREKRGRPRGH